MWTCEYCGCISGNRWKCCRECRLSRSTGKEHPLRAKICSVEGCNGKHRARGWCLEHYMVWYNSRG